MSSFENLTETDSLILRDIYNSMCSYAPKTMGDVLKHYENKSEYVKVISKCYKHIASYMEALNGNFGR